MPNYESLSSVKSSWENLGTRDKKTKNKQKSGLSGSYMISYNTM